MRGVEATGTGAGAQGQPTRFCGLVWKREGNRKGKEDEESVREKIWQIGNERERGRMGRREEACLSIRLSLYDGRVRWKSLRAPVFGWMDV